MPHICAGLHVCWDLQHFWSGIHNSFSYILKMGMYGVWSCVVLDDFQMESPCRICHRCNLLLLWESSSTSLSADWAKLSAVSKLLHGVRVRNRTWQPTKINHGSSSTSRCTKHRLDWRWWNLQKSGTVQKRCGGHDAWSTNNIQRALKD